MEAWLQSGGLASYKGCMLRRSGPSTLHIATGPHPHPPASLNSDRLPAMLHKMQRRCSKQLGQIPGMGKPCSMNSALVVPIHQLYFAHFCGRKCPEKKILQENPRENSPKFTQQKSSDTFLQIGRGNSRRHLTEFFAELTEFAPKLSEAQ